MPVQTRSGRLQLLPPIAEEEEEETSSALAEQLRDMHASLIVHLQSQDERLMQIEGDLHVLRHRKIQGDVRLRIEPWQTLLFCCIVWLFSRVF